MKVFLKYSCEIFFTIMSSEMLVVLLMGILAWVYHAARPPRTKLCGSPHGPPITAPRLKLRDGRHLAYKEHGVSRDRARHRIVFVHGFDSCRHDVVATTLSQEVFETMGIYIVSFDRPGYGESDPDPKQTLKSLCHDIEELADQLKLGSKFYVIGNSMGGQLVWSCLKYIPHRLIGVAMIAPVINYWWSGFPSRLLREAYNQQPSQDQWALRVAHYAPWLTYWWNTQKLFPVSSAISHNPRVLSPPDKKLLSKPSSRKSKEGIARQQGEYESIHRALMLGFGTWEFSPIDLKNPFPENEGSVHLWQGTDDWIVPVSLQRYIADRLPWIKYHELSGAGHLFPFADGMGDIIVQALLNA